MKNGPKSPLKPFLPFMQVKLIKNNKAAFSSLELFEINFLDNLETDVKNWSRYSYERQKDLYCCTIFIMWVKFFYQNFFILFVFLRCKIEWSTSIASKHIPCFKESLDIFSIKVFKLISIFSSPTLSEGTHESILVRLIF